MKSKQKWQAGILWYYTTCTDKWSRAQQLLSIKIQVHTSDKLPHDADAFFVKRFEIILFSGYIVEPLGADEQEAWDIYMLYLVKCEVSSKLKLIYKQRKSLGCWLRFVLWCWCCHSSKAMSLHISWNHKLSESNNGGLRRAFVNVKWISRFWCYTFLM